MDEPVQTTDADVDREGLRRHATKAIYSDVLYGDTNEDYIRGWIAAWSEVLRILGDKVATSSNLRPVETVDEAIQILFRIWCEYRNNNNGDCAATIVDALQALGYAIKHEYSVEAIHG